MAITTLDGVIAGMQPPAPFAKVGIAMAAVAGSRGYTPWYATGSPAASAANAAGVNGLAVDGTLGTTVTGRLTRTNPVSGNAYMARFAATATTAGTLMLIDRLWHNSGLSTTSTAAQAISAATLPSRSADGTTNGAGVMAAIEWSATGGAGTPTVTLTYTDADGTTSRTAAFSAVTTPPAGTFEIFAPNQTGNNYGVRAPTSFQQSATRTSGTMHLVLFRIIAQVEVTAANIGNAVDALTGGMPRIYDGSVLQLVWIPTATTATTFMGQYIETQG